MSSWVYGQVRHTTFFSLLALMEGSSQYASQTSNEKIDTANPVNKADLLHHIEHIGLQVVGAVSANAQV